MASSVAEICNLALAEVGAQRIMSLDDNTPEAKLCKQFFGLVRDDLLRNHVWNFAKKRVSMAKLTDPPAFGFANAFQLPADCLRPIYVMGQESYPWKREGTTIVTDNGEGYLIYIAQITEPGLFDASFVQVLAFSLAEKIAYSLVQSISLRQDLEQKKKESLMLARSFNGQEGSGDRVWSDSWLNARY